MLKASLKGIVVIVFCAVFLSACSNKMAYNFLGFITDWYIGKYVSLDREQKNYVDETMREFHRWHRETQLPLYANYIQSVLDRLEKEPIDGNWIHRETDKVQLLLDNSFYYLKPHIVQLMSTFSDEQAEELLKNLAKKREKYKRKNIDISAEKLHKQRIEEVIDSIDPYFGRLTQEQKARINQWAEQIKPYEALTLTQQKTWALEVEQALDVRHDKLQLAKELETVMFYRTDDWDPKLEEILDHNQEVSYALIADLINSQNEKQREKLRDKLEGYRNDCKELAAEIK